MIELIGKITQDKAQELNGQLSVQQLHGELIMFPPEPETYILVTEEGEEFAAVLVAEETLFDATENDIRAGTVAATAKGVTTGTKVIPSYNTNEGFQVIPAGSPVCIKGLTNYEYTKLQALFCAFNSSIANSVSTEKVCINDSVYAAGSTEVLSTVTLNAEDKEINFGFTNEGETPLIIRYFMYKEIY